MEINKNEHFSPLFLAGLLTKSLPKAPINILIRRFCDKMVSNHPAILERLLPIEGKTFLICPTDLPHNIIMTIANMDIDARIDEHENIKKDVIISGTFLSLLSMLDGKEDGDALFFNRHIVVEGDTEALLTLRNSMDSEDINLKEELLGKLGIFKPILNSLILKSDKYYQTLSDDLNEVNDAMIKPLSLKFNMLKKENMLLKEKIAALDKKLQKTNNKIQRMSRGEKS